MVWCVSLIQLRVIEMPEYRERLFVPAPVLTSEKGKGRGEELLPVYVDDEGQRVLWSGDFPLPSLESRVFITMNGIGWAVVKGYFVSAGYLGVMTLPIDPPVWLCRQWIEEQKNASPEWAKQGIGCEYGSELALVAPK
jgi:hypothetical protein